MYELAALSDAELDRAIAEVYRREELLRTDSGFKYAIVKMREIIGMLETWGYKSNAEDNSLAYLWASGLTDEIVRLGADGVKNAVQKWAQEDEREFKTFPQIPWIKAACKSIGGDPRVEKGRREQKEAERRLEEQHKQEMAEILEQHPELRQRIAQVRAEKGLV